MKRLVFVTGSRAEYGLLYPVLKKAFADPSLSCSLLVTGSHLREEYGGTVAEIEKDGFPIAEKLDILRFGSTRDGITQSVGLGIRLFGAWFSAHPADACIVLGDRYEIFAAAAAAALQMTPVVHISGGDVTWGAQDDWFRHSVTKMAALHFPYSEPARARLLRMGEEPRRVFNVGSLGAENIRRMPLLSQQELSDRFGFDFTRPYCLVTYHPETLSEQPPLQQLDQLLTALQAFPALGVCLTGANADAGGGSLNARLQGFVSGRPHTALFPSMGLQGYLSAMRGAAAVVGNSSSGVVETPEFGVPCVNIGLRQGGRPLCENILSCPCEARAISAALEQALSPSFAAAARQVQSPFYQPDTSGSILRLTKQTMESGLLREPKRFYDGACTADDDCLSGQ